MDLSLDRLTIQACVGKGTYKNDRISELPDVILNHILSFVSMKEAGMTSLLSKRWRYVWAYIRNLNFDGCEGMDETDFMDAESLEEEQPGFSTWVDQVVNSHKAPTIDVFKIKYDLAVSCKENISKWLKFAVEKNVKKLELDIAPYGGGANQLSYTLPNISFCNSLTFIRLAYVHVSGERLEKLLTDCQTLEFLSVKGSESLVNLKVVGKSINLKSLTIIYCFMIKHLEISAPNLEFLHYGGPKISSPFKNLPKLSKLTIGGGYADHLLSDFRDLSSFISQIEELTIVPISRIECMPEVFPICARVKILEIRINPSDDVQLFRLRFLLNACPLLHKLMLKFHLHNFKVKKTEKTRNVEACPHYQLKILEISDFVGWEVDTTFVMYLIESAVSLEKIIIEPTTMTTPWEKYVIKRKNRAILKAKVLHSKLKPGIVFQIRD